jgi:tRNA (cmo5U34)-methyltransferase
MNLENVKEHFEQDASDYDHEIIKFIPYYREQNQILMDLLPFEGSARIRALDLGAGTGVLADSILRRYPLAEVTVFDLAENMLAAARTRLAKFGGRVTYRQGDFSKDEFGFGYDLILSGLSIHHLEDTAKKDLYHRIFQALIPGGIFLNRDNVRGATERLNGIYEKLWLEYVGSMGADVASCLERYQAEDIPACVEDQLEWLREAGFVDVGCHWQRMNFAIFGGYKYSTENKHGERKNIV